MKQKTEAAILLLQKLISRKSIYLIFVPGTVDVKRFHIKEGQETIEGVIVITYLIIYNLEKNF